MHAPNFPAGSIDRYRCKHAALPENRRGGATTALKLWAFNCGAPAFCKTIPANEG
jgi:hypothetical protein